MSNGKKGIKWRFLVIEDNEDAARQLQEIAPSCVDAPDEVEVYICKTFPEAKGHLRREQFDILILDLKDDSNASLDEDENPAGLAVLEELKKIRFVPVVFYTAFAYKVRSEETSFVRVVEKTESVEKVRDEVRRVFKTRLPALTRHIEDLQRNYMWDFVNTQWRQSDTSYEQADIAYLLARRLALILQREAREIAREMTGEEAPIPGTKNIHPMEMYVYPPVNTLRHTGDVLKQTNEGESLYWIVLTPTCDFERESRLKCVLLAQCTPLTSELEYQEFRAAPTTKEKSLKELIEDTPTKKRQKDRFKFLPGTYFLPNSIIDFQKLRAVSIEELNKMEVVASLDSPFAEALLARFSRYYGRVGTPNIDSNIILTRLKNEIK